MLAGVQAPKVLDLCAGTVCLGPVSYTHLDVYKRQRQPEYWVAVVKPGRVLFELADVDEATAREALRLAMHKLSLIHI